MTVPLSITSLMEDVKPSVHKLPNLLGPQQQQWCIKNQHFTVLLHLHYQYQLWSMERECTAGMSVSKLILMWLFKQTELPWLLCQEMLVPFEAVWQWQPIHNHSHNATIINITSTNIGHRRNVCFSNVKISYSAQHNTASLMQACHLYII